MGRRNFTRVLARSLFIISCILSFNSVAVAELQPVLPDLTGIVKDKNWAIVLGKALFWDQQVGSDGVACASCHFSAGADSRVKNATSPGLAGIPVDTMFGAVEPVSISGMMKSGNSAGSNYTLLAEDFPFHLLSDHADRNSTILFSTNDRVSSAGSFETSFSRVKKRGNSIDKCNESSADLYHANGYPARMVAARNTPTMINAVFNFRNFWDGRASNTFNGVDVFGMRDINNNPKARILVSTGKKTASLEALAIKNASLASQAVGPPLSNFEMSCGGRIFADLGRKMLKRVPLALQAVHATDSSFGVNGPFGDLRTAKGKGLAKQHLYANLVEKAFDEKYWQTKGKFTITEGGQLIEDDAGHTQKELNFSMFWGLAIMLYESTLVSDDSAFDQGVLTAEEDLGRQIFSSFAPATAPVPGGRCAGCHSGALFSSATINPLTATFKELDRIPAPAGGKAEALQDTGFFNVGARPVNEDVGLGGLDPYGYPLSFSRQMLGSIDGGVKQDDFSQQACDLGSGGRGRPFEECKNGGTGVGIDTSAERVLIDGAFKTPSLRNVALTPPYFHFGGFSTLRQVVEFYNRGGNIRDHAIVDPGSGKTGNTSGTGPLGQSLIEADGTIAGADQGNNSTITPLGLNDEQIDAVVAFLKTLTDPRVQCDKAPFDHPELHIANGHLGRDVKKLTIVGQKGRKDGLADDIVFTLPAVGANGYTPSSGYCIPNAGDLFAPGMGGRVGDTSR